MDQVRAVLGWLKRQHFWVLAVIIALIAVACWWSASGKLLALYNTNVSTIKDGFSQIDSVRNAPFHPNEAINTRQTEEITKQSESVKKIWQTLYDKQREEVLKWPPALSQEFRDTVEKKNFGDDISQDLRDNYQNYIERHFPKLPEKIGARPIDVTATGLAGGGEMGRGGAYSPGSYMPGGMGGEMGGSFEDNDYICDWSPADQQKIRAKLDFPQRPSSLAIWVTQEDLWVYHTLLNVIAKTNQAVGATRRSNAAVQVVFELDVGRDAAIYSRGRGRLLVPPMLPSAAGMGPEGAPPAGEFGGVPGGLGGPGEMGPGATRMEGGMPGMGSMGLTPGAAMTPAQEQSYLLSFRYLDDKLQPVSVGGGGGGGMGGPGEPLPEPAVDAGPAPELDLNQFGTGYKRLPVTMKLRMDVRKLPLLIAACANEPLRVEVQEVRINPTDFSTSGIGGGMAGEFRSPMGGGALGASVFPDRNGLQTFLARPYEGNVVVQGIIYIFNKPKLNIAAPAADQSAAATN